MKVQILASKKKELKLAKELIYVYQEKGLNPIQVCVKEEEIVVCFKHNTKEVSPNDYDQVKRIISGKNGATKIICIGATMCFTGKIKINL